MTYYISIMPFFMSLLTIPVITFITTYTISAIYETQKYPYYFLSSSIDTKPSSSIGTFGLSLTSMLIPLISIVRYTYIKQEILKNKSDLLQIVKANSTNNQALKSSFVISFGALGVASFQDGIDKCGGTLSTRIVHLCFAFIFFAGGLFYSYCNHKIDSIIPSIGTKFEKDLRKWLWNFSIVQVLVQSLNIYMLISTPTDSFIFTMSVLEIVLLITFILMFSTFYSEMKQLNLEISISNTQIKMQNIL